MFVPFISSRSQRLYPRKGGGGKGGGSSGGGGGGGESGGGSGGGTGGGSTGGGTGGGSTGGGGTGGGGSGGGVGGGTRRGAVGQSVPGSSSKTGTAYGPGGGRVTTIPNGQPFAGRQAGGATRDQVYGSQTYGSGYPGGTGRGVGGLGLPFYFWPVVWGGGLGYGAGYLHDTSEYGDVNNSTRPGGPMVQTVFPDSGSNNTFHLLADNFTVTSLIESVASNCTLGNTTALTIASLNDSDPSTPRPEQAVQYYRASSVVLTLDGYNNTAALSDDANAPNTPLPPWVDMNFLNCLNQTIGAAVPLIDAAPSLRWGSPSIGLLGLVWLAVFSLLSG